LERKRAIGVTINGPEAQLKHGVSQVAVNTTLWQTFNGVMAIGIVEIVWFATHPVPYSTSVEWETAAEWNTLNNDTLKPQGI
jgi:hypothetical protein